MFTKTLFYSANKIFSDLRGFSPLVPQYLGHTDI